MFQNNAYYIYLPLDHFVLKPILSYVPPHAQNVADYNVCDNADVYDKWHESHIPISGFKDNIQCSLTDLGHGKVKAFSQTVKTKTFTVSFDDLYEYDDDGNLVAKDQTELLERMEEEETFSRIVSETEFYTVLSFRLMKMKAFSWQDAESKCKEMGLHLLNIHSITDLKHFFKHLFKYLYEIRIPMYTFYIGIHRKVSFVHIQSPTNTPPPKILNKKLYAPQMYFIPEKYYGPFSLTVSLVKFQELISIAKRRNYINDQI